MNCKYNKKYLLYRKISKLIRFTYNYKILKWLKMIF